MSFMEQVLAGDVLDTEIDDFVQQWHEGQTTEGLAEFLGFSDEEYALWVEHPESLRWILFCRKNGVQLAAASDWQEAHRMAAPSQQKGEADALLRWLKKSDSKS